MRIVADLHTHTVASGHAYSTVNELARAAADRGLRALAITDHGPAMPGGPHLYHFGAMRFIPPQLCGVRVLLGVEANIIADNGTLDLPESYLGRLDFVMAGFHEGCGFVDRGITGNTDTILRVMANYRVHAISHPGNPLFPVDLSAVVREAAATGIALEINNSSLTISRQGSRPQCEAIARLVAHYGALVVVGSDAHIAQNVGEFDAALEVIEKAGITEEQVVNSSLERLLAFLNIAD